MSAVIAERDLQAGVLELAHLLGYRVAHFRPARTDKGWRTPVAADGVGFPDLVLVRPADGRLIFMELKRDSGKLTQDQEAWMGDLSQTKAEVYVMRPRDWFDGSIERVLR